MGDQQRGRGYDHAYRDEEVYGIFGLMKNRPSDQETGEAQRTERRGHEQDSDN